MTSPTTSGTKGFTPGPWRPYLRDRTSNPPFVMKEGDSSGWIAQTCTWMGIDEAEANARLIAAAPDLFAALKLVNEHITDPSITTRELYPVFGLDFRKITDAIATALSKANGEHA